MRYKKGVIAVFMSVLCGVSVINKVNSALLSRTALPGVLWMTEEWTGDGSRYLAMRFRISHDVDVSRHPFALVESYKEQAELSPDDPFSVFCWAVAVWEAMTRTKSVDESNQLAVGVSQALGRPPSPHVYEYDRLRFFFIDPSDIPPSGFSGLLNRMLKMGTNDPDVLYVGYFWINSPSERQILLNKAIKISPGTRKFYFQLGEEYAYSYLFWGGSQAEGRKGADMLRKYLTMAPINADAIRDAKLNIYSVGYALRWDAKHANHPRSSPSPPGATGGLSK